MSLPQSTATTDNAEAFSAEWFKGLDAVSLGTITLQGDVVGQGTGTITTSLSSTLTNTINGKEPAITAGTTSQYWRGDKSWQTLNLDALSDVVISSPANGQILRYDGTNWINDANTGGSGLSIGNTVASSTVGSVFFVGTGGTLTQDNANLFWDDALNRLGIRTSSPQNALHVAGTSGVGQMRISYDTSNYTRFFVSSIGEYNITPIGTSAKVVVSSQLAVPAQSYSSGWNNSTEVPTKGAVYTKVESMLPNSYFFTGTASTSSTAANQVVDTTVDIAQYNVVEYKMFVYCGSDKQSSKILLHHDGATVFITEYSVICSPTESNILAKFDASIVASGGNNFINLLVQPQQGALTTYQFTAHANKT